ncbi:MAG: enterochelin esterase [Solirubrobacteraceae bacterium]|nr:enterochelin esterase [Solirubrobacteraceae bacterium]
MTATGTGVPARPPRVPKSPPPELGTSPRIDGLRAALADAGEEGRASVLQAFWTKIAKVGTPLVEPVEGAPGERAVTFLWRDRHGTDGLSTRTVVLLANKLTDPSVWDLSQLERIEGTDVWHRTYRMPTDWRATYQLAPDDGEIPAAATVGSVTGPRARWAGVASTAGPDPFCRTHFPGKPGDLPTSVVELEDAPKQPWRERRADVPRGSLAEVRIPSEHLDEPRRVWVYTPSDGLVLPETEHELLLLLDGEDWANRLDIVSTLDNLIAEERIRPTIAVLVDAIDTPSRWRDLTCNDTFVDFLLLDLLPWARAELAVSPEGASTTISGRSLGGITSLYAGLRAEGEIGVVHAQSPSLWFPAEPLPDGREAGWLRDALAEATAGPAKVSVEVGLQEWLLLGPSRELTSALREAGHAEVRHAEYQGGHDAYCWRGGLAEALVALGRERA